MPTPPAFSDFLRIVLKTVAERRKPTARRIQLAEDPQVVHSAFFELRKRYRRQFSELNDLHFITAGAYPYSPELTEALDDLQMSGAVARENPVFEKFSPTEYGDTKAVVNAMRRKLVAGDVRRQRALDGLIDELDRQLTL